MVSTAKLGAGELRIDDPIPTSEMSARRGFTGLPATSYRLESTYGTTATAPYWLLPATAPALNWQWTGSSFDAMYVSKLVLAACDGTNRQKWNASPSILASVVNGYHEN